MDIIVSKHDLIDVLERNGLAHREKYKKAFDRFQEEAIKWFEERLIQFKEGKTPNTVFNLPMPEDHTDDYKQMLAMLEMHKDSNIQISFHEYQNYVNDEWPWSNRVTTTNTAYGVK